MAQWFIPRGGISKIRPVLTKNGKLNVRTAVAYGSLGHYKFQASVYVTGVGLNAKTDDNRKEYCVWREMWDQGMPEEEQLTRLEFQCNVFALQMDLDYVLRLPHSPKRTPRSYYNHARRS